MPHTLLMYISACLRGIWTHFTQLTCSDTMLVRVSNCSSVEHDANVKHAFSFSLSIMLLCLFSPCLFFLSILSSSLYNCNHFPLSFSITFPSHFASNSPSFPIFPKTGFVASSAGQILFRCQIKIPGKSSILSQRWNKSRTLRVMSFGAEWHRFPPLALGQTQGLQLKGSYVAGVLGLFGMFTHSVAYSTSVVFFMCVFVFELNSPHKEEKKTSEGRSICQYSLLKRYNF